MRYLPRMQPHDEFAIRFQRAVDAAGLGDKSRRHLAKLFHVSDTGVTNWIRGEKKPGINKACEVANELGVSVEWLLTGRGAQYPLNNEDPAIDHLVAAARKLDPEQINDAIQFVSYLADKDRRKTVKTIPSARKLTHSK